MTLETFNTNFTVKVVKYKPCNDIFIIGYNVVCLKNETSRYFETSVQSTSSDPPGDAWGLIKADVKTWASSIITVPLRASFTPHKI